MPTTSQYVALGYDELAEIEDDIRAIEPSELAELISVTQFDCKAERVLARIRDYIELYLEEQSPRVQRHFLQAVRQLKAGQSISGPPPPTQIVVTTEVAFPTRTREEDTAQHGAVPTPDRDGTPCTLSGASSPFASSMGSDIHHDAFMLEPYRGIARKVRLGTRSLFGDDANVDMNDVMNDDDGFMDVDAVSCSLDEQSSAVTEHSEPAGPSWSRATSVVDLTDDHTSDYPQAADQAMPETVNERQAERHASPLDMADLSHTDPPDTVPEEEIPPWDSPYAGTWGLDTDDQANAADFVERFSEDGDEMDLDSLPGRPITLDFGPGKDIDGPQRESSIFAPRVSTPQQAATPERSARQMSPTAMHDAAATPPQTTVVNGIPTPLTGSFASAANSKGSRETSPTPAGRFQGQPVRSPTPRHRSQSIYQATVEDAPEFSPATSPVRAFSAEPQARVSEIRDSPVHSPAAASSRDEESPQPFRRGHRGRTGRSESQVADNEVEEVRSRNPSAHLSHRSDSSEPPRRHRPGRRFPLHRDHHNVDDEDFPNGIEVPFPPPFTLPEDDATTRAESYYWRIAANMAADLNVVSNFIGKLHGFTDSFMTPLRALCARYSELRTDVGELKRQRAADEETMRDLVRGRREDAEKIAELAEEVRELKMLMRESTSIRVARRFRVSAVEIYGL